jgi:hypothetical protein
VVAIVVAIVVVGGVVAFFLLKGGDESPDDRPSNGASVSTGPDADPVHFSLRDTKTIGTVAKKKPDRPEVQKAAKEVRDTLGNMYTVAFTDPDHWMSGNYDAVFGFFVIGKPAAAAKRDEATLTLGAKAGDQFSDVKFRYGGLVVKVLTDKGGEPFTVAATADFSADATKKDGSTMVIKSHATYYLQKGEGGWIIAAYKAKRQDGGAGAKPTASSGANQ